uniref:Uncharacterized protein n=1 Tax=Steinernema glaseri TaxID=37863 RepID=A0A1I7Z8C0_9BILA
MTGNGNGPPFAMAKCIWERRRSKRFLEGRDSKIHKTNPAAVRLLPCRLDRLCDLYRTKAKCANGSTTAVFTAHTFLMPAGTATAVRCVINQSLVGLSDMLQRRYAPTNSDRIVKKDERRTSVLQVYADFHVLKCAM